MRILKRNGTYEKLSFDKILKRIKSLSNDTKIGPKLPRIDADTLAQQVIIRLVDGMSSSQIDEVTAQIAISQSTEHPDYDLLATRIIVSNLHKNTKDTFEEATRDLYEYGLLSEEYYAFCTKHAQEIEATIKYARDYSFNYFGLKTLERSYLMKIHETNTEGEKTTRIAERPQSMWMRVAIEIHRDEPELVWETYDYLSRGLFTHASPTLFNAGSKRTQLSSCFIMNVPDTLEGIFANISQGAQISKFAGGVGISISDIRARGSLIKGTNGKADGVVPLCKVYNSVATYVNQGGKRNGSYAIYLEPWHDDIYEFLELKRNQGDEGARARDLFYALWIPDLFMEKVEQDTDWYLMSPDECPGLTETYGDDFTALYNQYVSEGKYRRKIEARELWKRILISQIETGVPYIMYKDAVNQKSNQKNIGVIKSSNLCAEICLYNDPDSTAVCNLASISLGSFVKDTKGSPESRIDYELLHKVAKTATVNLDKVIDRNYYPTEQTKKNNHAYRPIGVGVQGLANLFFKLKLPFCSEEAKRINRHLAETIYHACLEASCERAEKLGETYETYEKSPFSQGIFQFNMWDMKAEDIQSGMWDWNALKEKVKKCGLRNSQLTAMMPTASSSILLGNYESFEPQTSNIFPRKTLGGEYVVVNKYLVEDLIKLGMWSNQMKDAIILNNGSVQNIPNIPDNLKEIYKTVWEIKQKDLIDMSADRGLFVDQSQSLNIYMESATFSKLTSMHFYGWKKGLKTGSYYLRTQASTSAAKFTITEQTPAEVDKQLACSIDNPEACEMCSG
jgi:ribonucleoside-diphosphate reductase alpha chain